VNGSDPTDSPPKPSPSGAAFSLAGPGFHTGRWNRVRLFPGEDASGRFRSGGGSLPIWGMASNPVAEGRSTRSHGVGPLEHLSVAALVAGIGGWTLEADHPDLPLFDGSALPWAWLFARGGFPAPPRTEASLDVSGCWNSPRGGLLEVEPSRRFELQVEWTHGPFGPERWSGGVSDLEGVLPARTFVDGDEWLAARDAGWLQGTGPANGRLLRGRDPSLRAMDLADGLGADRDALVWSGGPERMANECAAHKALDLVGDIGVWIGYLPALSIRARDAGHDLHHRLGRVLREASLHT